MGPLHTCRRSRSPGRSISMPRPTFGRWAWCSTKCSAADCRFEGPHANVVMGKILFEPATPLISHCPELDADLLVVVQNAIERERRARFASVRSMMSAMLECRAFSHGGPTQIDSALRGSPGTPSLQHEEATRQGPGVSSDSLMTTPFMRASTPSPVGPVTAPPWGRPSTPAPAAPVPDTLQSVSNLVLQSRERADPRRRCLMAVRSPSRCFWSWRGVSGLW